MKTFQEFLTQLLEDIDFQQGGFFIDPHGKVFEVGPDGHARFAAAHFNAPTRDSLDVSEWLAKNPYIRGVSEPKNELWGFEFCPIIDGNIDRVLHFIQTHESRMLYYADLVEPQDGWKAHDLPFDKRHSIAGAKGKVIQKLREIQDKIQG